MPYQNKWCPLVKAEGDWSRCIKEECIFWDEKERNCDFKIVSEYLKATESCSRENYPKERIKASH